MQASESICSADGTLKPASPEHVGLHPLRMPLACKHVNNGTYAGCQCICLPLSSTPRGCCTARALLPHLCHIYCTCVPLWLGLIPFKHHHALKMARQHFSSSKSCHATANDHSLLLLLLSSTASM
jgi:hypothetical protein